jgi:WD40 repeat protein
MLRDLLVCFHVCQSWRRELESRGFRYDFAWLCASLACGKDPTEMAAEIRRLLPWEPRQRLDATDQLVRFLLRHRSCALCDEKQWARLAAQEPSMSFVYESAKAMSWIWHGRISCPMQSNPHYHACVSSTESVRIGLLSLNCIAISPDQKTLAICGHNVNHGGGIEGRVTFWDLSTMDEKRNLAQTTTEVLYCMSWSPRGDYLASAGQNGKVMLWSTNDEVRRDLDFETNGRLCDTSIHCLAWSPDGFLLACGDAEASVHVLAPHEHVSESPESSFTLMSLRMNGEINGTCSSSSAHSATYQDVPVCRAERRGAAISLATNSTAVLCLGFNKDGTMLACGGFDAPTCRGTVVVWDLEKRGCDAGEGHGPDRSVQIPAHKHKARAAIPQSDRTNAISQQLGTHGVGPKNLNLPSGAFVTTETCHTWHEALETSVRGHSAAHEEYAQSEDSDACEEFDIFGDEWSKAAELLGSAAEFENHIKDKQGDTPSRCGVPETAVIIHVTERCRFYGHQDAVSSLAWSPTDRCMLATGSDDRSIRFWDMPPTSLSSPVPTQKKSTVTCYTTSHAPQSKYDSACASPSTQTSASLSSAQGLTHCGSKVQASRLSLTQTSSSYSLASSIRGHTCLNLRCICPKYLDDSAHAAVKDPRCPVDGFFQPMSVIKFTPDGGTLVACAGRFECLHDLHSSCAGGYDALSRGHDDCDDNAYAHEAGSACMHQADNSEWQRSNHHKAKQPTNFNQLDSSGDRTQKHSARAESRSMPSKTIRANVGSQQLNIRMLDLQCGKHSCSVTGMELLHGGGYAVMCTKHGVEIWDLKA